MKTKTFFANAASKALALAAVVMMSLAFAACGSDNNDDGGGKTPDTPTPTAGTVTLDGTEKSIVSAEYEVGGEDTRILYLYLSADRKERVQINLNKDLHMTGSPVDLTKKEEKHNGKEYWVVDYYGADGNHIIDTYANPDISGTVFKTGTLTVTGDPKSGKVSIKLENGRVKTNDRQERTLTISYSGTMEEKY